MWYGYSCLTVSRSLPSASLASKHSNVRCFCRQHCSLLNPWHFNLKAGAVWQWLSRPHIPRWTRRLSGHLLHWQCADKMLNIKAEDKVCCSTKLLWQQRCTTYTGGEVDLHKLCKPEFITAYTRQNNWEFCQSLILGILMACWLRKLRGNHEDILFRLSSCSSSCHSTLTHS